MKPTRGFIISTTIYVLVMVIFVGLLASFGYNWYTSQNKTAPPTSSVPPEVQEQKANKVDDMALKNALNIFAEQKKNGVDLAKGPCLGIVAPDWVLDIVHNPRQAVDDKEENQCKEFRSGQVHHFIELDPDGKLIRTY